MRLEVRQRHVRRVWPSMKGAGGNTSSADAPPGLPPRLAIRAASRLPSAQMPSISGSRSPISSPAISSTRLCSSSVHEATSVACALIGHRRASRRPRDVAQMAAKARLVDRRDRRGTAAAPRGSPRAGTKSLKRAMAISQDVFGRTGPGGNRFRLTNPPPRSRSRPTPQGLGDIRPLHHARSRLDIDRIGPGAKALGVAVGLAGADVEFPAVPGAADDLAQSGVFDLAGIGGLRKPDQRALAQAPRPDAGSGSTGRRTRP